MAKSKKEMELRYKAKQKMIMSISLFFMLIAMFILTEANNTEQHELVHEKTCEYLGGEAEVEAGIFGGSTKCSYSATEEQKLQKYELDVLNEIVGYNHNSLRFTIWCAVFCLFIMFIVYKEF